MQLWIDLTICWGNHVNRVLRRIGSGWMQNILISRQTS